MKIVNNGSSYHIYGNELKTYDGLPAQIYIVRFSEKVGFYLEDYLEMKNEEKVYGVHEKKVNKVFTSFAKFQRNLGVILSGKKGIGKSLFVKLLAMKAKEIGYPVIVVDKFVPGIASFLEQIDQEVMVLFDEFDKTFANIRTSDNEANPQTSLLGLLNGITNGKKLFVITCNNISLLNEFLINRPGRIHYHFRFQYPSSDEICEYLKDNVEEQYYSEIEKVIAFSKKVDLNFDCLRAIAFEINQGEAFEVIIKDLNIINTESREYNLSLHFESGEVMTSSKNLDLFNADNIYSAEMWNKNDENILYVKFRVGDSIMDEVLGTMIVPGKKLEFRYNTIEYDEEEIEEIKKLTPSYLTITRKCEEGIHYNIR